MSEVLSVSDLCKSFGETPVLQNLSFSLNAGDFACVMGPSGSGKSTLLHVIAGLISADSGRVTVGDKEITSISDDAVSRFRRRHIGVMFQAFNLIDSLSVSENIVLPVKLDHAHPDANRLSALIQKLGLQGKETRHPAELSGGERQRVAIARALFAEPEVILADEPTGNLDVAASHAFCDLLRELNRGERSAILLVTHDPVVAATANTVHFLKDGKVAATFDTNHDSASVSAHYLETYR
ncbi:MAG: ABC transporter ATP-binding protein [Kiritimatiellae bacterium]|nr:ABC transporter ATP-binding protein [Kiritimatiellia bacterium]